MLDGIFSIMGSWNGQLAGYLVFCGIAVGVLLICSGLWHLFGPGSRVEDTRSRRMKMIAQGKSGAERLAILKPPSKKTGLVRVPVVSDMPVHLRQAGISISAGQFWMLCGLLTACVFLAAATRFGGLQSSAIALAAGLLLPVVYVRSKRKQMLDKLVS